MDGSPAGFVSFKFNPVSELFLSVCSNSSQVLHALAELRCITVYFTGPPLDDPLGCSKFLLLQIVLQGATWCQLPFRTSVSISLGWIRRCELAESKDRSSDCWKDYFPKDLTTLYSQQWYKRTPLFQHLCQHSISIFLIWCQSNVWKNGAPCFYLHFLQNWWDWESF